MRDLDIRQRILDELEFEPSVNAAEIGVTVENGVATLSGRVHTLAEKLAADRAARRVYGVKAVAEEIEVRVPTTLVRTDTDIAQYALSVLGWNTEVPKDRIRLKVENGWVTMEGEVPWAFQRETAGRVLRYLPGVKGVTNLVTVKPAVSAQHLKERIVGAFRRSADLDAKAIEVRALGDSVTLTGKVHSWTERREAERMAWSAPGVAHVANDIVVAA